MIDICSGLGFSSTYSEARLYEASATIQNQNVIKPNTFVQLVCDNPDCNVNTLDGKGTFHFMGSIQIVTPSIWFSSSNTNQKVKIYAFRS